MGWEEGCELEFVMVEMHLRCPGVIVALREGCAQASLGFLESHAR